MLPSLINYYNLSLHFLCLFQLYFHFLKWGKKVSTGPKCGHTHRLPGDKEMLFVFSSFSSDSSHWFPFWTSWSIFLFSWNFLSQPEGASAQQLAHSTQQCLSGLRWHRCWTDQRGLGGWRRWEGKPQARGQEPVFCVGFHTCDFTSQLGWISAWRSLFNSKAKISQWGLSGICQTCSECLFQGRRGVRG